MRGEKKKVLLHVQIIKIQFYRTTGPRVPPSPLPNSDVRAPLPIKLNNNNNNNKIKTQFINGQLFPFLFAKWPFFHPCQIITAGGSFLRVNVMSLLILGVTNSGDCFLKPFSLLVTRVGQNKSGKRSRPISCVK